MKDNLRNAALRVVPLLARRRQPWPSKVKSVLVMRPDHLGDLLFTFPSLRLLRSSLPDAHIAFLGGPWARPVLENNSDVDETIYFDFPWFNRRTKRTMFEPYSAILDLARLLRARAFDATINLRFDFWWGTLTSHLAGIPIRAGYDITPCNPFLTHRFRYISGRHEVEQNVHLVSQFLTSIGESNGFQIGRLGLNFHVTEEDERAATAYLLSKGIGEDDTLVAIHPGSGSAAKQWDPYRFALVANDLVQAYDCAVIVTGTSDEKELAGMIAGGIPGRCVVAAGETTIGQLAAILQRCDLAIGVDSGPMHLAVAVGTPSIHLFGPSDHHAFGPFGDAEKHRVVHAGLPCIPCGRFDFLSPIKLSDCMAAITTKQVLDEAVQLLKTRTRR